MSLLKQSLQVLTLLFTVVVLTGCYIKEYEGTTQISHHAAVNQQFCKLFYEQLIEQAISFDVCYKHAAIAAANTKINWSWFWISEDRLLHNQMLASDDANQSESSQHQNNNNEEAEIGDKSDAEPYTELIEDIDMPIVYLTFDDGPGKYTDKVLDILKEENIKATFFVLGIQAERNPLFTKRIVDEGHSIGNHTYDHDYKKIYGSFDVFAEQVVKTNQIIYELTGVNTTLLRAPGGTINNFDEGYFSAVREAGFKVFDWNLDSKDSQIIGIKKDGIIKIVTESKLYDPAIVLLHDTNNHEQSMLALKDIITYFRDQGYQFAPITPLTEEYTFRLGKNLSWSRQSVSEQHIVDFQHRIEQLNE